jgi:hypothetical protein
LAAAVFRLVEGPSAAAAARAIDTLGTLAAEQWQPGALTGMLNALAEAGVPTHVPVVRQGLEQLRLLAEPDGCWSSEDGDFYDADVTLRALRVFLLYGVVSPPALSVASPAGAG